VLIAAVGALVPVPAASAKTKVAYAGQPGPTPVSLRPLEFNTFFPRTITVNAGDSVRWVFRFFHTVTFPPTGRAAPPLATPDPANPIAGFTDAAGAPFWFNGQPSLRVPSSVALKTGPPVVDGSSYHNSGVPLPRQPSLTLRFSKVGTFRYLCVVHPGMAGTVKVVPRGVAVPSVAADRRAAAAQQAAYTRSAFRLNRYTPPPGVVASGHDAGPVALLRFFPRVTTIRAGQSLRFSVLSRSEIHTATFGPPTLLNSLKRGLLLVSRTTPSQPPVVTLNPQAHLPSDRPPLPPFTGGNHGNGFFNTGQLDTIRATPFPPSIVVRFSRRGTYTYVCLVHPGMGGQIRVV
jgi:plastocyanin